MFFKTHLHPLFTRPHTASSSQWRTWDVENVGCGASRQVPALAVHLCLHWLPLLPSLLGKCPWESDPAAHITALCWLETAPQTLGVSRRKNEWTHCNYVRWAGQISSFHFPGEETEAYSPPDTWPSRDPSWWWTVSWDLWCLVWQVLFKAPTFSVPPCAHSLCHVTL